MRVSYRYPLAVAIAAVMIVVPPAFSSTTTCSGEGANPFVYNFEVNGYPAKILNDLVIPVPVDGGFFVADPGVLQRALRRRFQDESMMLLDNNILYVDMDGEGVLVDSGNGPVANDFGQGMLFDLLESEGISRESIKHVLLTHAHPDHVLGVVEDTVGFEPAFPDAVVHISRVEYEYWMSDPVDNGTSLLPPEFLAANIITAQTVLGAVEDQIEVFEMDEEPLPGVMPVPTPWHTAGSVAYAFADGNDTLVFTGDGLAHQIAAIENPWITFLADWMPETGPAGRYELLDMAVKERWQLLSGHASFPGLLNVDHQGINYQTTAASYRGSGDAMSVCLE